MSALNVEKMIAEINDRTNRIEQALRGYGEQPGLIENHENLKTDYYKFKRLVLIVFAFIVGSGALGVGAYQIAQRVAGG